MSNKIVKPKRTPEFILRNIPSLCKMLRARNPNVIENSLKKIKTLDNALYPFEGAGKPMDVGMIYLMFNSEGKSSVFDIDTVTRIWWGTCKQADFHFMDVFLLSEKFPNSHFREYYSKPIFNRLSEKDFHRGISLDKVMLEIDGNWNDGYDYSFDYKFDGLNLKADHLKYKALNQQSALIYANGKPYIGSDVNMKFYHLFGVDVKGGVFANGKEIPVNNGRGVFEHGVGIFGIKNLKRWEWLNLQSDRGSMHFFNFPIKVKDRDINIGEAASVIDGNWTHYVRSTTIEETKWEYDETIDDFVPINWKVYGPGFKFDMVSKTSISWKSYRVEEHKIKNYIVAFKGEFGNEPFEGKGTYELLKNLYK